ncbi:MAG: pyridoxamine 5'-phosphate oxidase family protein [Bacteroidia bacterium]|nr:pyridoxamine 5'-phosphate oxidase family protein [Bacteroidia bacterium]NND26917.1 pyridoxamine 5'-phosphate oxidase family protein [Flavobacteriaceae bacterium]MBT8277790.1 pyridoxamine 5'-phosphate oxidase family protein [Bacteroidia bacterium]NNK61194.1 pyridoxamine 5'-phosphate oxidase family protein [Flavobacteriaceae bacterium]NNL31781.1 pyridoxamine 5'-phosphate oxidase family protein [Flavobacteriaceae bacterium]
MGKRISQLTPKLIDFISLQKVFFVGTAMKEGTINVSPKGMDSFRVLDEKHILWLNLTGSGNETATHLIESERMTIMFCAFEGNPLILRLYGQAKAFHPRDEAYKRFEHHFPNYHGKRQIIKMQIELVQTSCGFGVPLMHFDQERNLLSTWAEKKGPEGIEDYWKEKNTTSLDGHETQILNP